MLKRQQWSILRFVFDLWLPTGDLLTDLSLRGEGAQVGHADLHLFGPGRGTPGDAWEHAARLLLRVQRDVAGTRSVRVLVDHNDKRNRTLILKGAVRVIACRPVFTTRDLVF